MADEHSIHHVHEFLPHLARRQPDLLSLLPAEERPSAGMPLNEWVLALPQRRLMEICTVWVLESLRRLRTRSPLTNVMLRGCLLLAGEFDVADAAAVSIGEELRPGDPRRDEVRTALGHAARLGILIHIPADERYCIPFPVRLSFEGVEYTDEIEREVLRLRMIRHYGLLAGEMDGEEERLLARHWRFSNILAAWEAAAELFEDLQGLEPGIWVDQFERMREAPESVALALTMFGRVFGRSLVGRPSDGVVRLLAAGEVAARTIGHPETAAQLRSLIGQHHLRRGAFGKAVEYYRRSEAFAATRRDWAEAAVAGSAVALALRELGKHDLAVAEFIRVCAMARERALVEAEIDTGNCALRLLLDEERTFEAVRLAEAVTESQARSACEWPGTAELYTLHGAALRAEGRPVEAREKLFTALGLARSRNHRPAAALACLEIGRLHGAVHEHDDALKWYRRSRVIFGEVGDGAGVARTNLELARSLRALRRESDCDDLLLKALRAAQHARAMDLLAEIWRERAQLRLDQQEPAQAIACHQQEIKALRRSNRPRRQCRAHLRLVDLYSVVEDPTAAIAEALRAQALSRAYQLELQKEADDAVARLAKTMSPTLFEFAVEQVTEELERGGLGEAAQE